jgi:hypothetical protein
MDEVEQIEKLVITQVERVLENTGKEIKKGEKERKKKSRSKTGKREVNTSRNVGLEEKEGKMIRPNSEMGEKKGKKRLTLENEVRRSLRINNKKQRRKEENTEGKKKRKREEGRQTERIDYRALANKGEKYQLRVEMKMKEKRKEEKRRKRTPHRTYYKNQMMER